jgi:hypothetical protein
VRYTGGSNHPSWLTHSRSMRREILLLEEMIDDRRAGRAAGSQDSLNLHHE